MVSDGCQGDRRANTGKFQGMHLPSVLSLTFLLAAGVAASAEAKAPPAGRYDCVIGSSNILFGTLTIKGATRYTHRGSKGTFSARGGKVTYPDKIVGYKISFKGGTLDRMKGRWFKATDGTPSGSYEIALRNPGSGFESIYCDRRK